jgi:hypothetical protein
LYQARHDSVLLNKSATTASPLEDWQSCEHNNLPKLQDAGFFGRSKELWQIERAFVQNVRSIAITGFGGQGKTYLAIEAGAWCQQTGLFSYVCFVDYAAFQGVDAVGVAVSTLATVLKESLIDANATTLALKKLRLC